MRLVKLLLLATASGVFAAWGRGRAVSKHAAALINDAILHTAAPPQDLELHPIELRASSSLNRELYEIAHRELTRLKDKPICHRIAAHLFVDNCKGLDSINEKHYNYGSAALQKNQVDSFSVALASCEMERADFEIPRECDQFRSDVLYDAYNRKLKVHYENKQIDECVTALGKMDKHWSTWLSYRDSALLFCRAARVDLAKDESIAMHQRLVEVLEVFTRDLEADLNLFKDKLRAGTDSVDIAFKRILKETDVIKSKIQKGVEIVSEDIETAGSNMKAIILSGAKAQQLLETLSRTIFEGLAEMATSQRTELELTTKQFATRFDAVNERLMDSERAAQVMGQFMITIHQSLVAIAERQGLVEEKTAAIFNRLLNATELLEDHHIALQQASVAALGIREELEEARSTVGSFTESFNSGSSNRDWIMRMIGPPLFLMLGNYGLEPSLSRNAILLITGGVLTELIIHLIIHCNDSTLWHYLNHEDENSKPERNNTPSSILQQLAASPIKGNTTALSRAAMPTRSSEFHPEMVRDLNITT